MPSKVSLVGQSDIWDLSDYFPPGEPWESSYKWYKVEQSYSTTLYPVLIKETYTASSLPTRFSKPPIYTYADQFVANLNITTFRIKSVFNIFTTNEQYTLLNTVTGFVKKNNINTYTLTEIHRPATTIIKFELKRSLITSTVNESYTNSPSVRSFTKS